MGGGSYGRSYSNYVSPRPDYSEEIKEGIARRKKVETMIDELIDLINLKIIRPGPKPEERVCTEVAEELKQMKNELTSVAYRHIKKI